LVVRANTDRETYPVVERPALLVDRSFGSRLLLDGPRTPQEKQQLHAMEYRHVQVEDEEWLSNHVTLATERPILSPGDFAPAPPKEERGFVDFDEARYQIEGPRQRSPTRGIADFIYEIEREAFDSRRLDGDAHSRSPGVTDTQLERAMVPWSSSRPSRPRLDTPGPQTEASGWFGPQQPSEGYGSVI
jgi:hypothetical protein